MSVSTASTHSAVSSLQPLSKQQAPVSDEKLKLEMLQQDMEQLRHAISHDVRSPLRAILSGCETLNALPSLPKQPAYKETCELLEAEAVRMKGMLQGVLDYINLATFVPAYTGLDCNELLADAKEILDESIKSTGAEIHFDALPSVHGHRGRITRLFVQLIENALKFNESGKPVIHISAVQKDGMWEFCVQDNGIGMEPEYQHVIFDLCRRLHVADAYSGLGVGLALCSKIVQSTQGKLWVESEPGKGSRFYFTLPAHPNA